MKKECPIRGISHSSVRVSGIRCIEHLNNSEKIGWIWGRSRVLSLITEKIPKNGHRLVC